MSKQERYWINAAIYILLSAMFGDGDKTVINSVAVVACYLLSAGYFVAMIVEWIRSKA